MKLNVGPRRVVDLRIAVGELAGAPQSRVWADYTPAFDFLTARRASTAIFKNAASRREDWATAPIHAGRDKPEPLVADFVVVRTPLGGKRFCIRRSAQRPGPVSPWVCVILLTTGIATPAFASDALCFDFSTKVVTPLKQIARLDKDNVEKGTVAGRNVVWASVRGEVPHPIEKVFEKILHHETVCDKKTKEAVVARLPAGEYLVRTRVSLLVQSFLFKIPWDEEWVYALAAGTPDKPDKIVISYQKVAGSSHIQRFCGNIVLERTAKGTDVTQYQEARFTRNSSQGMVESLTTILGRLRAP